MTKTLKTGDKVSWSSHGGTAHGKVVKKVTSPTRIKSHKVAASKDNPEFIVETDEGKKAAHKAGALIVFDDPFNSQDSFRRRQTVLEIAKIARRCAQVIVLSHDPTFLKQVWDKSPNAGRVALGIIDHRLLGSKISEIDLERECAGRTATDLDDLQSFISTGAGQRLDLIRKMRVVLETYLRNAFHGSFLANDWLGDMVRRIREGGDAHPTAALYNELDEINGYSSQYHHGEDNGSIVPEQIDPTELTGYVRRTLRLVNATGG